MEKKIYLVGGAVRDKLMDTPCHDKDYVAVGYDVSEFSHLQQVGKDFPVFLQEDGSELALARVERKTGNGYNGFSTDTANISLEEDLQRRDLTINSIAYDEQNDNYIDPYDGFNDIKNKVLKHTSDAFCEDPIRVLRIARFRARFGHEWNIHPSTKVLIYQMRYELQYLQKDRVYKEIEKVLTSKNSYIFFETLFELGVLDMIFPSLYNLTTLKEGTKFHKEGSVFIHTMMVLKELDNEGILLKLTALYHDIAKPECYKRYGNGSHHEDIKLVEPLLDITIPAKVKNKMLFLIANHIKIALLADMRSAKLATFFESFKKDRELLITLLKFKDADNKGRISDVAKQNSDYSMILKTFDAIATYSPKEWIDSQEKEIKTDAIVQHIHKQNIEYVKKYLLF